MDLITTHVNADFDALGSLVAAKKLYPEARLLLPGSQEKSVREFLALCRDMITVESERSCDLEGVTRLILVDTRHKSRIGIAAQLVDKGVEIHIYDHHPRMKGDITADKDVYEEVGATVTFLAEMIRKKRIRLSYLEATLMLLGIYEETGSLTYRTTTRRDVDMVSFLLSHGANLSVVSSYLNRELSEEELSFLTKLINAARRITVKGISVAIAELDAESYVGELGMLIHKLLEIENIPVLFVLIKGTDGRVNIVARSRLPNVDVNRILGHFGGGGHPTAASAKIRGVDMDELKKKLIATLKSNIRVRIYARDIMSRDAGTIGPEMKIEEARLKLAGSGLKGAAVTDGRKVAGIVTAECLDRAMRRGSGSSRVKGCMIREFTAVNERTPLHSIHRVIIEKDAGVIPVVKNGELAGVIYRTDVLRRIHDEIFSKTPGRPSGKTVVRNLAKKMSSVFPRGITALLKRIGVLADRLGCGAFVVGGLVRDLMLGVKNLDLDIVIEGDATDFGRVLAAELGGSLIVHKRFGTAAVVTAEKLKIDLATARKERYEKPAALPTVVEFGSLKNDLIRRDFTINAMAISLNKGNFGQLIDFFGGEEDLLGGRIRVMHEASFIDDPTRIFRAVRFEQRFGFAIDPRTEELIRSAVEVRMFDRVEPQRIRDEIALILKEKEPLKALSRMAGLDELRFIHPGIRFDGRMKRLFRRVEDVCRWYEAAALKRRTPERWIMYMAALLDPLDYGEAERLCERFVFRRGDRMRILSYKREDRLLKILAAKRKPAPSAVYRLLEPLSYEVILLLMAKSSSKAVRSRIRDFLIRYNGAKISLKGRDLKAMGLKPGPRFTKILKNVLYRKIDGRLKTRQDELRYARELAKRP